MPIQRSEYAVDLSTLEELPTGAPREYSINIHTIEERPTGAPREYSIALNVLVRNIDFSDDLWEYREVT
jgi:hypothetical protein